MTVSVQAPARQDTCRAVRPAPDPHASQRALWRLQGAHRRRQQALGLPATDLIDAQPARDHVRGLQAAGMGWQRVAEVAEVPRSTVDSLLHGSSPYPPSRRIRRDTARTLLAVRPDPANLALLPGVGARRRLQALIAVGWTSRQLAAEIGWGWRYLSELLNGDGRVRPDTDRVIRDLYERLWDQQPPQDTLAQRRAVSRARGQAAGRGWVPPMAWDDDTIDDPDAQPDTGAADGRAPVDLDEVDHLAASGVHIDEIARRLAVGVGAIKQARWRAGRAS